MGKFKSVKKRKEDGDYQQNLQGPSVQFTQCVNGRVQRPWEINAVSICELSFLLSFGEGTL